MNAKLEESRVELSEQSYLIKSMIQELQDMSGSEKAQVALITSYFSSRGRLKI